MQADSARGDFALGSAQAAQCLLCAACSLALRLKRRPANIAPGKQDGTSHQAEHGETQQEQRRQGLVRETGKERPVEIVIIEWREVRQPTATHFPSSHYQEQEQDQQTACPACCRAAASSQLGDEQRHHAKEEGKQAQVQPRQQRPDKIDVPTAESGFAGNDP